MLCYIQTGLKIKERVFGKLVEWRYYHKSKQLYCLFHETQKINHITGRCHTNLHVYYLVNILFTLQSSVFSVLTSDFTILPNYLGRYYDHRINNEYIIYNISIKILQFARIFVSNFVSRVSCYQWLCFFRMIEC